MADLTDPKAVWQTYLHDRREALIGKVADLSEREARLPRTSTGTNLLGLIKHVLNMEAIYLGATFNRPFPDPDGELVTMADYDIDPQVDGYAAETETLEGIIDLYRRVIAHAEATVAELDLDAPGRVDHWGGREVSLQRILVHIYSDLCQHCGHADILRESIDGQVGWRTPGDNIPDEYDWSTYRAKLTAIADRFPS